MWRKFGIPIIVLISLFCFVPWAPYRLSMTSFDYLSVDAAFILMLPKAFQEGIRYGQEVVFTYGPWGFVTNNCGPFGVIPLIWIVRSVMAAVAVLALVSIVIRYSAFRYTRHWAAFGALGVAWIWLTGQSEAFLMFPAIYLAWKFLWCGQGNGDHRDFLLPFGASCLFGLSGLIKCEFMILGIILYGALALFARRKRRILLMCGGWVGTAFLGWLAAGQHLVDFPRWLYLSCELMSGYSDAMAKGYWAPFGRATTAYFYAGVAMQTALLALLGVRNRRIMPRMAFLGFMSAISLFSIKHAFGGNQIQQGGAVLLVQLWLLGIFVLDEPRGLHFFSRERMTGASLLLIATAFYAISLTRAGFPLNGIDCVKDRLASNGRALADIVAGRLESQRARWGELMVEIRENMPTPKWVSGTADIYPQHTGILMAAPDLQYRPRPVYLTFAAYTGKLLEINAEHLRGWSAPQNVFFQILPRHRSIDNRHPATADGPSWPEFLTKYKPVGYENSFVILRKRTEPATCLFVDPKEQTIGWNEAYRIEGKGIVWAEVVVNKTFRGKLLSWIYKSPTIEIEVGQSDGSISTFQMVPELGKAGFVISPLVIDSGAFMCLYYLDQPEYKDILGRVENVTFRSRDAPKWFWSGDISIRTSRLKIDRPAQLPRATSLDRVLCFKTITRNMRKCLAAQIDTAPGEAYPTLLFHAPCEAEIKVEAQGGRIRVGYGIRHTGRSGAAECSDGAGFEFYGVSAGVDGERLLLSDWFDPARNALDRRKRTAYLPLKPGESAVRIVTRSGNAGDFNFDHTYISDFEFLPGTK